MKKLNQAEYIERLIKANIKIEPLETYINRNTKILHKCTCEREWRVTPKSIFNGNKCGCEVNKNKRYTHKDYIKLLKSKKIKVKPLEEYINSRIKINHKCLCENTWKVSPNAVLKGSRCGCGYTYKDRKTILYYIKVNELWKIGVCLHGKNIESSIKRRYTKDIKNGIKIEILRTKVFEDGLEAYLKEQTILENFKRYRYLGEDMKWFYGYTELFNEDIGYII